MTRGVLARRIAAALGAGAAACALSLGGASVADAKIEPVDTQCNNRGGQQPGGQQPSCGGAGLIQETENQNQSGHAPAGRNK